MTSREQQWIALAVAYSRARVDRPALLLSAHVQILLSDRCFVILGFNDDLIERCVGD